MLVGTETFEAYTGSGPTIGILGGYRSPIVTNRGPKQDFVGDVSGAVCYYNATTAEEIQPTLNGTNGADG